MLHLLSLSTFISAFRLNLNHWVWPFKKLCTEVEMWCEHIFQLICWLCLPEGPEAIPRGADEFLDLAFRHIPVLWKIIYMVWQDLSLIKLCWLPFAILVSFISNFFPGRFGLVFFLLWKSDKLINGRLLLFSFVLPFNKYLRSIVIFPNWPP